jgi:protein-S-isoprenylcysteine O-methyltransferase Ste14
MIPPGAADPGLIRALGLFVPFLLFFAVWRICDPPPRSLSAALLATLWNLPAILFVNEIAFRLRWWHYQAEGGLLRGMPFDLCIGWMLLWGGLPALLIELLEAQTFTRRPILLSGVALLALDCVYMPLMQPVLILGPDWLWGELLLLALCFLPAQLLARWTQKRTHLQGRVLLQILAYTGLFMGVIPAAALEATSSTWALRHPVPGIALFLLPALIGLSAVQEFALRGGGTPVPFDAPPRLVRSGIYAYLRNPMQVSQILLFAAVGLTLGSYWIALLALTAFFYSAGFASGGEALDLQERFGTAWTQYRADVPAWLPRWRPYANARARLVLGSGPRAASFQKWLNAQAPSGLEINSSDALPTKWLRYEALDGSPPEHGFPAMGRALEHIHFGWACLGFLLRLPSLFQRWP